MNLLPTPLDGVLIADTKSHADSRGAFTRLFCEEQLTGVIKNRHIVQVNHSRTRLRGAIRGVHYQNQPFAEMKFIRCLRGAAWDVAVDLRAGSSTFLAWHGVELTPENGLMMIVPEGCGHGFQVLSAECELLYLHTALYSPDAEGGLAWNDPSIGIAWPLPLPATDGLSRRDRSLPALAPVFLGLRV